MTEQRHDGDGNDRHKGKARENAQSGVYGMIWDGTHGLSGLYRRIPCEPVCYQSHDKGGSVQGAARIRRDPVLYQRSTTAECCGGRGKVKRVVESQSR